MPSSTSAIGAPDARSRLRALGEKKPPKMAARIRGLWPDIKSVLEKGYTLNAVCECLEADGIRISPTTLGSYVARIRKREVAGTVTREASRPSVQPTIVDRSNSRSSARFEETGDSVDPLANLRKSESNRQLFDYRPELADPEKLI